MNLYKVRSEFHGGMDSYELLILSPTASDAIRIAHEKCKSIPGQDFWDRESHPERLSPATIRSKRPKGLTKCVVSEAVGISADVVSGHYFHAGDAHNPNIHEQSGMFGSDLKFRDLLQWSDR